MEDRAVSMSADDMLSTMMQDKKVQDQKLVLVLMKSLGEAFVAKDIEMTKLQQFLEKVCS